LVSLGRRRPRRRRRRKRREIGKINELLPFLLLLLSPAWPTSARLGGQLRQKGWTDERKKSFLLREFGSMYF
jgi:hypothetical protein